MNDPAPIRVLVVDDHTLFREGLAALLAAAPQTEVAGQAGNGVEAVSQAAKTKPDVILMDIMMPELNGIEASKQILARQPGTAIVMLTMLENDDSLFAAMRAGARGYILKGADKAEVLKTIQAAAAGDALFGATVAGQITSFFQRGEREQAAAYPFPELTGREREVLELIAGGASNQAIARRLQISPKTVSNHISNIFNKMQVTDRAQAIVRARQAGVGQQAIDGE